MTSLIHMCDMTHSYAIFLAHCARSTHVLSPALSLSRTHTHIHPRPPTCPATQHTHAHTHIRHLGA